MRKVNFAFTLAEVLITLGIIGIVAAMTIPSLMQRQQEKATIVALKKTYSALTQAYTSAESENGTPEGWGLANNAAGAANILNKLSPYLKLDKNCGSGVGCFPDVTYKTLTNSPWNNFDTYATFARAKIADGSLIAASSYNNCNQNYGTTEALQHVCGYYYVDVNGFNPPNQGGKDLFLFWLTKNGIVPGGSAADTSSWNFTQQCINIAASSGEGCGAWVIYNENLDYTRCPTSLSWTGAKTCP